MYEVPFADFPVAPAGEQNAPGVTVRVEAVGVGVGVGVGGLPTRTLIISDLVLFVKPNRLVNSVASVKNLKELLFLTLQKMVNLLE